VSDDTYLELRSQLAGVMDTAMIDVRIRTVAQLAAAVRGAGRAWCWVEGFPEAGKSTLASALARELRWRHVELDSSSYGRDLDAKDVAEHIDPAKVLAALGAASQRQNVVADGVCLRDIVRQLGNAEPAFAIYLARVSRSAAGGFIWHDGLELEGPGEHLPWLSRAANDYYRRERPQAVATVVLLRVAND